MDTGLTVLVLAAGLGTRMKSKYAKVLHKAGGRRLVEHVVRAALDLAPAGNIFVVTGYQGEQVEALLEPAGVRFVRQVEPKGTGHAVAVCREQVQEREGLVLVLYGDCPLITAETLRKLVEHQRASSAALTLIYTRLQDPTGYGRIVRGADGSVEAIVEQKAATAEQLRIQEVNPGYYCFRARDLWEHVGRLENNNPAGEYYLTDMVAILRAAGRRVDCIFHEDAQELMGINTRAELALADRILRERTLRRLMLEGVTIEKPETVTIDDAVQIGRDTVIEPFARILGNTVIGEDCRIGAAAILEDCTLEDGVEVAPFTLVAGSHLESGVHVGPFARLRMGCHLEREARVGNFVEMKKTRFGAGSKAMHLAYLGDATIGARVNIGAGTITCNYDGVAKHPTRIADGAFIGSNSTLVAPLEIGAGSYVGAGSVITKPVPEDALAVARERQVVKEAWAKRRRERLRQQS
jgi:bifunctional UDP-N-acetylglucosamine pyrophosphorylase/glucosamine-1-phosphate N-acetyltransferase